MTIKFQASGNGKGYGDYVLREYKKLSKAEREKITELAGDMKLGDEIVKSSNYKDNAFNIILGFKGSISKTKAKAVLEDFEKLFMYGFSKEEYHLNAVLHQDAAHHHIHIRIPKKNLLTDTTLRLYMDSVDRDRVNLIRDYLEEKHDLERVQDNFKIVQDKTKEQIIQEHRVERGQKPFDFSKKKGRDKAQNYIVDYIEEAHEAGLINSIDNVKSLVEDLDIEYVRSGHDFKTDTHYLTFKNDTGKLSLKGELFNERFYTEFKREDREKQIKSNTNRRRAERGINRTFQELEEALKRSLSRRHKEIGKRYEKSRQRARERNREIQERERRADKERESREQQQIHTDNSDVNYNNGNNGLSSHQKLSKPRRELARTKREQIRKRRGKVYSHTQKRYTDYERREYLLYTNQRHEKRGVNGAFRETDRNNGENKEGGRRERTSSYERFREARESLYEQAQSVMRDRANRRGAREQYQGAIDSVRDGLCELQDTIQKRFSTIVEQSRGFISTAKELTRAIKRKIANENYQEPEQEQSGFAP